MSRTPLPRGLVALALGLCAPVAVSAQAVGDRMDVAIPGTEMTVSLVGIPAGSFRMGSPASEAGRDEDEGPPHAVTLPAFWMTSVEITHDQYAPFRFENFDTDAGPGGSEGFDVDAVTRPSPPYEDPSHGMGGDGHAVTGMTRWNALQFARWLSEKTGRLFRLPTEAEWEYACRSGEGGAWGPIADADQLTAVAWLEATAEGAVHPVASLAPSRWGLYDMHGNVAEWVMDGYAADAYAGRASDSPAVAPMAGLVTRGRGLVRGGAFDDGPAEARCAARHPESRAWKRRDPQIPKSRWWNTDSPHVGFRLVSPAESLAMDEIRAYWEALLGE